MADLVYAHGCSAAHDPGVRCKHGAACFDCMPPRCFRVSEAWYRFDNEGVACRLCGCTEDDCYGCIERTGEACSWVEADLCSACVDIDQAMLVLAVAGDDALAGLPHHPRGALMGPADELRVSASAEVLARAAYQHASEALRDQWPVRRRGIAEHVYVRRSREVWTLAVLEAVSLLGSGWRSEP